MEVVRNETPPPKELHAKIGQVVPTTDRLTLATMLAWGFRVLGMTFIPPFGSSFFQTADWLDPPMKPVAVSAANEQSAR